MSAADVRTPAGQAGGRETSGNQTRDDSRPTFPTVRAKAALAGFEVYELAEGGFLVCRWGMVSRALPDIRTLLEFLRRVGVPT